MKSTPWNNLALAASFTLGLIAGCGGRSTPAANQPIAPSPDPAATPSNIPANAITIPDIQRQPGWQSCTACTGSAIAIYSLKEGISSPSLSGSSAQFSLLPGTRPFAGALWFKFLTSDANATHFVYDLSFYTDNPSAPQALEFNVSQSTGGKRYNLATQCDLSNQRSWLVWSPQKGWVSTGVPCVQPPPNTWNHLIWEFERDSSGHAVFTAVTMNGSRSLVNISMPAIPDSSEGIDIAFQLDADRAAVPYSVWLDNVKLSYW